MKYKDIIPWICLIFLGFSPVHEPETMYYYSLKFLKSADEPKKIKLIKIDNISEGKPIVLDGVLFTYKNRKARDVHIAGNFSNWDPFNMARSNNGVWYYFHNTGKNKITIKYKFMVDGIWSLDPKNSDMIDDGIGSYISLVDYEYLEDERQITFRNLGKGDIEFRIHMPDARMISLVGDFNNWNPENDLLKKGDDGITFF